MLQVEGTAALARSLDLEFELQVFSAMTRGPSLVVALAHLLTVVGHRCNLSPHPRSMLFLVGAVCVLLTCAPKHLGLANMYR